MGKQAIAVPPGVRPSDIQQEAFVFAVDTGTANNYAASLTPAPTLVAGSMIMLEIAHTNTGASTLALNGGAAKAIKKRASVALSGGELLANQIVLMVYDGTNWQLVGGVTWATIAAIQQQSHTYADDSGSANAYVVTLSPAPTAIVEGSVVAFKAANANTGASTLNVNGNGAVAIKKNGSTALASGDIHSGQIILAMFDGTNWQIVGGSGGGTSITLETNGTLNGSQTLLNQVAGSNMTITDDGSGDVTFACSFSASSALALNFGIAALGQPPGGSVVLGIFTCPLAINFAANFTGSKGDCQANPTGAQTWNVQKNGSTVGTVSISTGGAVTFATSGGSTVSCTAGDVLTIVGSSSTDATLSGVDIVLLATLASAPTNPQIIIPACWLGQPGSSQLMLIYTFTNGCTFPANWSGAKGSVQANPTSTWTANVKKNGTTVGTIQVSTSGVFTFATTGGATVTFVAGDELTIVAPSTIDATLQGFSATLYTSTGGYMQLGGDLGGTATSPVVIAINGYSVALGNDDTGSANAYAVSTPYTFTLAKYAQVTFKAANANTGASTLNVNSGGAVAINKGGSTALASGDIAAGQMVTVFYDGTNWQMTSWSGASGGSSPAAPSIRGTGIQASSASSYTVNWPTGTVAGDLAIIFTGGGFGISSVPSGWTTLDMITGASNWNGSVFCKVLTSGDISTGHVVVSYSGTFDAVTAIITIQGTPVGFRTFKSQQNGSGSSSVTLRSDVTPLTTDLAIYFGSNRAASTDTVSLGTQRQQANDGSAASGCLYTDTPAAIGGVAPVFSYSSAGSGNYQAIVVLRGS